LVRSDLLSKSVEEVDLFNKVNQTASLAYRLVRILTGLASIGDSKPTSVALSKMH
jgi:hypothetical protein